MIKDPNGNELRYSYDAEGRLTGFTDRRQTDKIKNGDTTVIPTTFAYSNSGDEYRNYLSTITDALGVTALTANYNTTTGRLESLTDAASQPMNVGYDTNTLTVTNSSASGNTSTKLDTSGNPVSQTSKSGQVTEYSYDAGQAKLGLPATTTQVIGGTATPKPKKQPAPATTW